MEYSGKTKMEVIFLPAMTVSFPIGTPISLDNFIFTVTKNSLNGFISIHCTFDLDRLISFLIQNSCGGHMTYLGFLKLVQSEKDIKTLVFI